MAWNEPGGNNNDGNKDSGNGKDPWGNNNRGNNSNQGPPDLDELLKEFSKKFGGLFGSSNNGGDGGGTAPIFPVLALLLGGALLFWFGVGFYQVDQQERAVVLRLGKFQVVQQPGLRWHAPLIDRKYIVNVTRLNSYAHRDLMLTKDLNIVKVDMSVQYNVSDPKKYVLAVREPEFSLKHAAESALRHVVGSSLMDQVLTEGREQIAVDVKERLQNYLEKYTTGIQVIEVNINDTSPPEQVQASFDDVNKAREDEERVKNEAEAYANAIVPEARGRAKRMMEEAEGYKQEVIARAEGEASRFDQLLVEYRKAPEVTRERLYLDAMQNIMQASSKVMIDVQGGNNLLYLPLDKMMQRPESTEILQFNQDDLDRVRNSYQNSSRNSSSNRSGISRTRETR